MNIPKRQWAEERLDIKALKQQAYDIKIATGCVLGHAMEQIAKNHGYGTWAALLTDQKAKAAS